MTEILEIPENLCRLADNGAKKSAYFSRCRGLVTGGETLTIAAINELFGYDYEDGFDFRKQVFNDYFNGEFDRIADAKRFTPEDEQQLRDMCAKLDIPYEFKANIDNALTKYRYFRWKKAKFATQQGRPLCAKLKPLPKRTTTTS